MSANQATDWAANQAFLSRKSLELVSNSKTTESGEWKVSILEQVDNALRSQILDSDN
jgi:hypothetical protein